MISDKDLKILKIAIDNNVDSEEIIAMIKLIIADERVDAKHQQIKRLEKIFKNLEERGYVLNKDVDISNLEYINTFLPFD